MPLCPLCGATYDDSPGLAGCPVCLLRIGLRDALEADTVSVSSSTASEKPRQRIGPYTLLEVLGVGGMGEVFLAEQCEPIHRRVAVKVIRAGLCSPDVLARFEAEREALALMSHPAIAAVLDAGTTDDGRPFVVMEYVPGVPITDYCDRHRLDLRHRLGLFREVCGAVQHAHHKGIVHRDLKPSNVLVTEVDGEPRVKVIDFGLAKALHGRLTDAGLLTRFGMVVGTPAYMSPEQISPTPLDVDTRTDVYSLGVLLYELLAGVLPFSPSGVREVMIAELRHLLLELEPEPPSRRVEGLGERAVEVADHRGVDTITLRRLLRDDLDWIVLHALERDRSRRYQSAGELAADVERHLDGDPVSAGPPSAAYRLRKLARRHRTVFLAIAAAAAALLAGAIASSALYLRAEQARRAAEDSWRVAERRGYVAELGAADASLEVGSVAEARRHLELCPAAARGWEWRHLAMRTDASTVRSHIDGGRIAAVSETADGEIACVVVPPAYDEQHRASLRLYDPGHDSWRRSALEGSVLAVSPDGSRAVTTPWWFGGELGGRPTEKTAAPASERGELHLVDLASGETRCRFSVPAAGRWEPSTAREREALFAVVDSVMVSNDLGSDAIRTLEGHYPETVSAVFSGDGAWLAAWSWDNVIRIWDPAGALAARQLAGHSDGIIDVAVAPGGDRVVSSSWDRTLRLWDPARGVVVATVQTESEVTKVAFSPDGRELAWGDHDGRVFLAEADLLLEAQGEQAHRGAVRSLAFSPDGSLLASGGMEGEVRLWQTRPLRPMGVLRGCEAPVMSLAFGNNGRRVVAGGFSGDLRVFETSSLPTCVFGRENPGDLNLIAAAPGARGPTLPSRMMIRNPGAVVRAWDAASGSEVWQLPLELPRSLSPISWGELIFTPMASGFDAARARGELDEDAVTLPASVVAALSPDGRWVALEIGTDLQLWELPGRTLAGTIPFTRYRTAIAFRPDASALLIAGLDGMVHVLNMANGDWTVARNLGGHISSGAWSPDGSRLALHLPFDRRVAILDSGSGETVLEIGYTDGPAPESQSLSTMDTPAFSPDGSRLAVPIAGRAVALWDATAGERLATFSGHASTTTCVAFSPDGARLVTGAVDGEILVWDAGTGDQLVRLESDDIGRQALPAVEFGASMDLDRSFPVGPGALLRPVGSIGFGPAEDERSAVAAVGFSADGRSVGATFVNGEVRVWNAVRDPGRSP